MIIKLLLVASLATAAFTLMRGRRSALRLLTQRSLTLAAIGVGVVAVVDPATVTDAAELVGVGRGTDLLLYLLSVAFMFVSIALYLRLNEMNDRYVVLARRLALNEAAVQHPRDDAALS